jgi:hypothetical protein
MKTIPYPIPFALVASFALGAMAVQTLHAQSARKGYIITATDVTGNPDVYKRDYIDQLPPTYAPFGARYLYGKQSRSAWKESLRADTS